MSREMEQQEAEGQSPYAMHVDALLDRFSALVEHAQSLVFPPLRKGVTAPLDMTGWSRFRRLAYRISSPLPTNFGAETFSYYTPIFAVWLTISIYWIHVANATLHVVFKGTPPATSSSVSAVWVDIMVWVIWVTMGVLTLASYWLDFGQIRCRAKFRLAL